MPAGRTSSSRSATSSAPSTPSSSRRCGNRHHWEEWANDIAKIAQTHIDRITNLVENPKHKKERAAFEAFATELRDDLNDSITDDEVIEMLAQHLITKPVFDALFAGHSFADREPDLDRDAAGARRAAGAPSREGDRHAPRLLREREAPRRGHRHRGGAQKIIVELYDKFFRNAFPKMTERLGIVYTPVEIVDFILHSVDAPAGEGVRADARQRGRAHPRPVHGDGDIHHAADAERADHAEQLDQEVQDTRSTPTRSCCSRTTSRASTSRPRTTTSSAAEYEPFPGILLTDTFQLYEKEDLARSCWSTTARDGSAEEARHPRDLGNPPYSAGQASANDNNRTLAYPSLDERIATPMRRRSAATLKKGLYDSYVRAIRWASDRVGKSGIVGFVTNANFLEANTATGLRQCLVGGVQQHLRVAPAGQSTHAGRAVAPRGGQDIRRRQPRSNCHLSVREEPRGFRTRQDLLARHRRLSGPRAKA
jgi:predicted helicase